MSFSRRVSSKVCLRSVTSTLRVSGMEDDGELLSYSERTSILPARLMPTSETICLTARKNDNSYDTYLKRTVGISLKQCLQEMTEVRPEDPIEYIAQALYKFSDSEFYRRQKLDFLQKLIVTREQMKDEEARSIEHFLEIKKSIQEQRKLFDEIRRAELDELMTLLIKYNIPFGDFEKRLLELAEIYGLGDIVRNIMKLRTRALTGGANRNLERMLGRLKEQYEQCNAYQLNAAASQTGADGWDPILGAYKLVNGVKVPTAKLATGGYEIINGVRVPIGFQVGNNAAGRRLSSGSLDSDEEEEDGFSSYSLADEESSPRSRRPSGKGGRLPPLPSQEGTDRREARRQRHLARIRDAIMADMEEGHFIVNKRGQLIFMSNVLGVICPRQPPVKYANPIDNPTEWTDKGFHCEAFYEHELYSVCDARPDDWSDYPFIVRMTPNELTKQKLPPIGKLFPRNPSVRSDDLAKMKLRKTSSQSKHSQDSTSSSKELCQVNNSVNFVK